MLDSDTFLTTLYCKADDFTKSHMIDPTRPGPSASLSPSEVITLAIFGKWQQFQSERGFYRFAQRHLRQAFPNLPHRSQFNRLLRIYRSRIVAFFEYLVEMLNTRSCLYESLDSSGIATRDSKRRGSGWLAGLADIGWSNRVGWYEGFHLLTAVNLLITRFGFAPASTKDQPIAETFFALRGQPSPRLSCVGKPAQGCYIVDKGFKGEANHLRWRELYQAEVICPPRRNSRKPWPKQLRRFVARIRQIVETVYENC